MAQKQVTDSCLHPMVEERGLTSWKEVCQRLQPTSYKWGEIKLSCCTNLSLNLVTNVHTHKCALWRLCISLILSLAFFNLWFLFNYGCVCVCLPEEECLRHLKLEWQVAVSYAVWSWGQAWILWRSSVFSWPESQLLSLLFINYINFLWQRNILCYLVRCINVDSGILILFCEPSLNIIVLYFCGSNCYNFSHWSSFFCPWLFSLPLAHLLELWSQVSSSSRDHWLLSFKNGI